MNYHRNVCDLVSLKWITIALAVLFLSLSFEASEVRGQDINVSTRRIAPFVEGTEYTIDVHLRTTSSNVANKPSTDIVINSNYGTVIAPDAFCVFAGKPPGCIGENICDGFTINTPITFTPAMWSEERSGSVYIWTTSTIPITLECPASVAAPASFGLLENHYIFTLRHGRVAREIELFYEDNTKFDIETELSIVQIDEGASAELGVRLASDPHSEATVIITGSNNTDLDNPDGNTSPNPTSLTFDATNYSDYQYFELWAKIDPDPDSETIPLTLTPADPRGIGKTVEVTVDDLYVGNPIVSINEVKINKGGTETFFVQLSCVKKDNKKIKLFCDANSATPVTIKITGHSGKGLTLSREEIKFTAGNNWTSDEYVTITADPNIAHDEIPLTITAQSGTHGFSGSEIVTVKIDDVDPTPNVEIKDVPPQIGNTDPFTAQFEWNKNVSYFGTEDVTVDGGAKGSWTRISNDVYTLDVTPAGSQDVVVTVLANRAEDGTGRTGPLNDVFETAEWIKIEASPLTQEIKEGQTGTLDVRLSTAPTKTVTVTIVSDKSDLLINPSTLTFEPTDFGDQEVTLTAQSVSSDQKVTLTLTGNNVSDGSAEVTIKNEPQALSVSLSAAPDPVTEGSAVDITAILNQHTSSAIDIPVVITTGTAESGDYTSPNPSSVKITSGQISGKVPITTNDDSEVEGDETFTVKLGLPLPPGVTAGDPSSVEVTIKDNDSASEPDIVAEDVLTVNEGSFAELDVSLTEKPINNVTITISGLQGDLSSDENDLTFTPDTWNTNQSFTLRAAEDADFDDETITLTLSASGGSSDVHPVAVTIQDDDELDIIANDVTIQEGGTATLSVGLSTQPSGDVTIQISGYTGTDLGATPPDPSTLTFTTINWETDQDITLSAQHDPDPDDDTETLTLSASGGGYDGVTHDVAVIIQDDDELDIIANDVTIQEGGTATLSVGLSTQPSGDVTIQISGYTGTDLGATPPDPSTLTFTTINWETDQDITLSAQHDPDPDDDTETLTLSASGGGYDGVTHDVAVIIQDDDELDIIANDVTIQEGGTATLSVGLSTQPSGDVTIQISGYTGTDLGATPPDPSTLTFTTINWETDQDITLSAQHDPDPDDDTETLTLSASGGGYDGVTHDVAVIIQDDDELDIIANDVTIQEGGTATLSVGLSTQPSGDVTIQISGYTGTDLGATPPDPSTLTFTTINWETDQDITLSAQHDPDPDDDTETLTLSASGGGYDGVTHDVAVIIQDDDELDIIANDVTIQEGGTATLSVGLSAQPSGDVTIQISGYTGTDLGATPPDPSTLTFTTINWETDQDITLSAQHDPDPDDDTETLTLSASGGGYDGVTHDVAVIIQDDDELDIIANDVTIQEGGTATLSVGLSTQPSGDVTIQISGYTGTDLGATPPDPSTLTFTTINWETDQDITLSAQHDPDPDDDTETLTLSASGGGYDGVTHDVAVIIQDDDELDIIANDVTIQEGGTATLSVGLSTQPSGDVTIQISGYTGTDLGATPPDPSTLTFTTINWETDQDITLSAQHDPDPDDDTETLTLSASGGGYDGVTHDVAVIIQDDDELDIIANDVTIQEGGTATLSVGLSTQPSGDVTIQISGYTGTDLGATPPDPSTLTFTTINWETDQDITLSAQHDPDPDDDTETLTLSASGGGYDGVTHDVAVIIQDDDELDIIANDVTIQEGGTATLSVGLSTQPSGDVTIQISGYTGTDLGATPPDPSTLTFTTINWETDQDITLSAQHDPDPDDDTETLTLSASGGGYDGVTHDVAVIIQDDDELDIIANDVTIQEGGTATLSVGLSTQPSGDVTIQISGYTGTDLGATPPDPSTLTFTTINWETDQDITLSAQHDPDPDDDTETLTLSASGGGYDGVTHPVAVTIEDDDELDIIPTVSLSAPNTVDEGDAVTITASLSEIPLTSQNIPLNISDPSDGEYTLPNLPVININAGELSGTLDIQTNQDADNENELITVALGNLSSDINPGDPSSVDITIVDDESIAPTVSLSATPLEVVEGGSVTVTATLSSVLPTSVSIGLTEDHITTEPADFDPISSITIPGGELVGTAILTTNDDDIAETDESFLIGLGLLPPEVIYGDTRSVEITILDDGDVPPPSEVSLLVDPQEVKEGDVVTVELHLSQELLIDVVIPLEYTSGTAEDEDYIALDNVTIPAGEKVASGQIMTIQDLDIDDEIFTVALGQLPSDVVGGRETSQTVTILDNFPREASLSANPNPVDEGAPVSITVTLNKPLPDDVIIPLVVTEGTATEQDYETTGLKQIEISTGETTGSYGIDVLQDNLVEDDETFMVSFGTLPTVIIPVDPAEVEVIITDDDMAGINVPSSVSIIEGSTKTFDIALRSIPSDVVTVTLSGYSGTDLTVTPVSIRFMPGSGNQVQQVTLNASEDEDFTNDEVSLILVANGGEYTGITDQVLVTITDNDVPGINALSFLTIEEGSTDALAVSLTQQPLADVTITARSIRGLIEITPASLTLTPNNWNNPHPQAFQLMANEDEDILNDRDEIILSATGGGYDGVEHQLSVTITDDDVPEIIAITEITMDEGGEASFEVRLSAKPWDNVLIDFSGYEGTQLIPQRNMLVFTSLTWNTPQIVKLVASEDDTDFDDNIVNLVLTATGGGYDNVTHTVNITIVDNDRNPDNLSISIYDQQEPESNGTLKLQVELSWRTEETVTVQYKTSDIEAVAGSDYTQSTGIVIFSPGAIRGTIVIDLTHDDTQEDPERFEVTLSNPKNAIIARGTGVGTILDDDGSAYLRIDDALAEEVEGEIKFRIVLSQIQTHMISAVYQTVDGTAKAGKDYVASSGVVTIPPGVTETTITVPLLRDDLDWQEETFTVHLVSSNEAKIAKSIGVATIQKTISVSEEVLEAYTARFVRTVATEVVDALTNRFRSGRIQSACGAGERAEMAEVWSASTSWNPSLGELLSGCQLATSLYNESWNLWGRGGFRRFNGQGVDEITIDGEVTTGMFGLDYRWKPGLLTGVLLVHSEGSGSFEVLEESGEVLAGVTSIYPYASYAGSDWEIWMSAGLGQGNAEVLELEGDLASRFGAMGIQGVLASGQLIRLDYQGDVLLTDARIKEHDVMAEVYRIRAGVEASAKLNEVFHPYISSNVRRDGGSAETGFGLELGGGIRISYPDWALRGEVKTQGLVMHTENSFSEWGMSGSLQIGLEAEGLMMRLRPSWGRRNSMSILSQQTIWNVAAAGPNAHQIEMEIGYGIPWKKGAARSVMGMTRLSQGAMYRLGGELRPLDKFRISVFGITHAQDPGRIGLNVQSTLQY